MRHPTLSEQLEPLRTPQERPARRSEPFQDRSFTAGFSSRQAASAAARRLLLKLGVSRAFLGEHFQVVPEGVGRYGYVLTGTMAGREIEANRRIEGGVRPGQLFHSPVSARNAARTWFESHGVIRAQEGQEFRLSPRKGGWTFEVVKMPLVQKGAIKDARGILHATGYMSGGDARRAAEAVVGKIKPGPVEGVDYWIVRDEDHYWSYTTLKPAEQARETPMVEIRPHKGTVIVDVPPSDAPRAPSYAEKARIRKFIEEHYDEDAGHWLGFNDESAATTLNVPRAWVTQVRESYGPDLTFAAPSAGPDLDEIKERVRVALLALRDCADALGMGDA